MSRLASLQPLLLLWTIFVVVKPPKACAFMVPSHPVVERRSGVTALGASESGVTTTTTVISPDDSDFQFDTGLGGVRLAQESAVCLNGSIKHGPSGATVTFKDMVRYTGLREVTDNQVQDTLNKVDAKVICTGRGQELYKDPGNSLEKVVALAPLQAAEDAAMGASPASEAANVVINVLGGDDLQFLEVKDAMELLVPKLAIGKAKVKFHSLCHASLPLEQVTITAVALPEEASSNGMSGAAKSVAEGQVFFRDGKWWTVVQDDINTAVA